MNKDEEEKQNLTELVGYNDNPKIKALIELIENVPGKMIIWTKFIYEMELLERVLQRYGVVKYAGKEIEERVRNKDRFRTDPDTRFILINQQSGAEGLTLPEAENAVYFTNGYSFINRQQSEARNHDITTTKSVTYFDMSCNGTLDNKILKVLKDKKTLSDLMLDSPYELFTEEDVANEGE
jgi:SNF2 family DNA or RNA helicase